MLTAIKNLISSYTFYGGPKSNMLFSFGLQVCLSQQQSSLTRVDLMNIFTIFLFKAQYKKLFFFLVCQHLIMSHGNTNSELSGKSQKFALPKLAFCPSLVPSKIIFFSSKWSMLFCHISSEILQLQLFTSECTQKIFE